MNVFEFRQNLVDEYEQFTRSFTRIQAQDIRAFVDTEYDSQKYWPEPLVQVNPNFQPGGTVEELCAAGQLSPACAEIFRFGKTASSAGQTLPLYRHQVEAISLAAAGESYVLTTGTGSGKSLSYFIPIIEGSVNYMRNVAGDGSDIDNIILFGGGQSIFARTILSYYKNHTIYVLGDAQFANTKGYQAAGEAMLKLPMSVLQGDLPELTVLSQDTPAKVPAKAPAALSSTPTTPIKKMPEVATDI